MFYSYPKSLTVMFLSLLLGMTFVSRPAFSDTDESMDQMHKRMQEQGYPGRNMPYGMGYGGMGMMGQGMGYGGMGMMGQGMGYGGMGMMGHGMGYGGMGMMGHGMGFGGMGMMQLSKKQRTEVRKLFREQRAAHFKIMNEMMVIRDELADKYDEDVLDAKAIGKIYARMFEQKRKMIEQSIETRNKIRALLSKEQRSEFDQMHRGGMMGHMGMMQ